MLGPSQSLTVNEGLLQDTFETTSDITKDKTSTKVHKSKHFSIMVMSKNVTPNRLLETWNLKVSLNITFTPHRRWKTPIWSMEVISWQRQWQWKLVLQVQTVLYLLLHTQLFHSFTFHLSQILDTMESKLAAALIYFPRSRVRLSCPS